MEKNIENEMETKGIWGFQDFNSSYYIRETHLVTMYTNYGNLISVHGSPHTTHS